MPESAALVEADTNCTLVMSNFMVREKWPMLLKDATVTGITTDETPGTALEKLAAEVTGASAAKSVDEKTKRHPKNSDALFLRETEKFRIFLSRRVFVPASFMSYLY